jgi:hypothetical protein
MRPSAKTDDAWGRSGYAAKITRKIRFCGFAIQFLAGHGAGCDSKANLIDKSEASSRFVANFSSTNQRADSFSSSGVNLEAKV